MGNCQKYDSPAGAGYLTGGFTGLIIAVIVSCMYCRLCSLFEKRRKKNKLKPGETAPRKHRYEAE